MCTAITYETKDFYFGRNLDLEYSYQEAVTVTPRAYPFSFRCGIPLPQHYAIIGTATVARNYPLYYEATNEKGLSMAGLNFPGNAVYHPARENGDNIAPFELIPWVLGQCESVAQAEMLLSRLNIWEEAFSQEFPLSPLHWMLADRRKCLVLESTRQGLQIYENPCGVLTNNPPFPYHRHHLAEFLNLTVHTPENRFSRTLDLKPYSLGMGGIGLPGDLSSASRFVRAAFTRANSLSGETEHESVSQFFHILGSVSQTRGLTEVRPGAFEYTLYSSCCNTDKGIYYYTTYENSAVTAVDMHKCDLDGKILSSYPMSRNLQLHPQN